jgi:hypothetical protein
MKHRVGPLLGETREDLQQTGQHLARLIAAVGEDNKLSLEAHASLCFFPVAGRAKNVESNTVRNVLAGDPAVPHNALPIPAHGHRYVDLVQEVEPTGWKSFTFSVAVNREVQEPGRVRHLHLASKMRS